MKGIINKGLFFLYETYKNRQRSLEKKYVYKKYQKSIGYMGKEVFFNGLINLIFPEGLSLGNNVHIGKNAHFDCRGGVVIGDHTHISRNVTIYSTNHDYEGDLIPYNSDLICNSVIIGKGVWIGMNVSILPGVKIGDGAIIAMGSVISKDVPAGKIAVSNQQRLVAERNIDSFDQKLKTTKVGGRSGYPVSSNWVSEKCTIQEKYESTPQNVIFIFSTSSYKSLKFVSSADKVEFTKEIFSTQLSTLCVQYLRGLITKLEAEDDLRKLYSSISVANRNEKFIEFHSTSIPLLSLFLEVFPDAKFVWFVEHPRLVNESYPKIHNEYLSRATVYESYCEINGLEKSEIENSNKSVEELRFWKRWNSIIYGSFQQIPPSHKFLLKSSQNSDLKEFGKFLQLDIKISGPDFYRKESQFDGDNTMDLKEYNQAYDQFVASEKLSS
ncbi:Acetyltransferase (isoleucine patch superfamily) [Salinimicrobium catena]|uniref:Acetyltransferase (Isoleucine patch superfamily) n=1 Tax=Salinimicrobium catena TaxID=390640 RepID=A0A1H5LM97_9FLAO|nr:DapH/DapD/GlmU-related protein [Salinimicrobium catena]SDL10825.1 Acetyltransferase (isoleucine patch superfamily) [Salinimicrobium catena]SEE77308.1 Acetyltransferase (isoleucine patch superfamily) [Salinimicrobium catena]